MTAARELMAEETKKKMSMFETYFLLLLINCYTNVVTVDIEEKPSDYKATAVQKMSTLDY